MKLNISPREFAYALIRKDIEENGTQYFKCANCGQPYVLGGEDDWSDTTVCCQRCFDAYLRYIQEC
jgi:DNA-directed RNA polymerase subunit RPC12/RpoP